MNEGTVAEPKGRTRDEVEDFNDNSHLKARFPLIVLQLSSSWPLLAHSIE
jgi:hypothetical protein